MKKTKQTAFTAILAALYFLLSALLKIPVAGHITLDLGYIALTVGCFFLGAGPGALIGAVGAFLESAMLSSRGVSVGWILMNAIAGYFCGKVLHKRKDAEKKKVFLAAFAVVPSSMLAGVIVKTFADCIIYSLPLLAKIPTSTAAWFFDSAVMLGLGIPLCLTLRRQIKL